jgi:formate hydrogenlyase subunit 6
MKKVGSMLPYLLKMLTKKPSTIAYPFTNLDLPENFRGKLKFEQSKCIGCKICERECPSDAIKITKVADKVFQAELYLDRCIFCGQCVDSCPKYALECTKEYELSHLDKSKARIDL